LLRRIDVQGKGSIREIVRCAWRDWNEDNASRLAASLAYYTALSLAPMVVLGVVLLKSTFALRALERAALDVERALGREAIDDARFGLRSLCSRDASHLDPPELVAATIESVAENLSDSFVAPLFYYALFGIPGAMAYRSVNTLDAMIGYHGR